MNAKKSDTASIEERNKLLLKHLEDGKLEKVRMMEKVNGLHSTLKAVSAERDEYVEMIEDQKSQLQRLNIQLNQHRERFEDAKSGKMKEEHLMNELKELQQEMVRMRSVHSQREERLQRQCSDEKDLRISAEQRNQELSLEMSSSTQPLLRQMDALKNSQKQRRKIWENLEQDLRAKLLRIETENDENASRMNRIRSELEDAQKKESKLRAQCLWIKKENAEYKAAQNELMSQHEDTERKYNETLSSLQSLKNKEKSTENERRNLELQMARFHREHDNERNRMQNILASESKKREELQKTITILSNKVRQFESYGSSTAPSTPGTPKQNEDDILVLSDAAMKNRNSRNDGNMWTVSRIQNELRQKQSELDSIKQRMAAMQSRNNTFSDQIVQLKSTNETLNKYQNLYKNQSKQINALKLRYEAAIDIVMEKEKEIQKMNKMNKMTNE